MGQPPMRRVDPRNGRRDLAPGDDRRRLGHGRTSRPITLRLDQIERVLGIAIDPARSCGSCSRLGLEFDGRPARGPSVPRPSWRSDLEREIDLIEEVARIHGYEHIPEDRPSPSPAPRALASGSRTPTRSLLTGLGFDEAVTISFVPDELVGPLEVGPDRGETDPGRALGPAAGQRLRQAWCRACWPSAGTTRPTATRTSTSSRSPTST